MQCINTCLISGWIYRIEKSALYDKCLKDYPGTNPKYGGKLCNPKCQRPEQVMETSLAADVGLYYHFESDPKTGQPYGCDGFKDDINDWQEGKGFSKYMIYSIHTEKSVWFFIIWRVWWIYTGF